MAKIQPGQKFGQLTIIKDSGKRNSDGSIIWLCECECGNKEYYTVSSELNRKPPRNKTHCDNIIHSIKDITGQVFNDMRVDSFAYSKNNKTYWSCTCLACNTSGHVVRGGDLKSGRTASCGCKKSISKGAKKVKSILQDNNISFVSEYHFDDLKSNNNKNLYFDFAVFDNDKLIYLIEYDGEQHYTYQSSTKTWNTKEHFLQTKERDSLKDEYCKKNNIPLYRIPYYDIESINQLDELINKNYLV